MIKRVQPQPSNWFAKVRSWITFVNGRRQDRRFPVWPLSRVFVLSIITMVLVLALLIFVDARFLELVRANATKNNWFFGKLTLVAQADWILYSSGFVILLMSVLSADRHKGALNTVWHRFFLTAYFIFTSVALSGLITNGLKICFGRLRPPFVEGASPWEAVPFHAGYNFASFPSGHSTTSGALAMALALLFPRLFWPFLILGVFVASSRSFIGVHFPSDVVMGLALGAGFTWIYARSFAQKRLLFVFDDDGKLALRREGRGHINRWTALLSGK